MDDRAKQAVFGGRRRRRIWLGRGIGRTVSNRPDRRLRSWPAECLRAMDVIEENDQLHGEREKRTPRPKSKVRANPAHQGANPTAIFRETGGGWADTKPSDGV
jgi:hypothetical protein